jgi:Domain of unknown function (DUF1839)
MAAVSEFESSNGYVGSPRLAWTAPHPFHQGDRAWHGVNAHVDVWVELLHVLGLEPAPVLLSCLCADFEGDQWTFSKVAAADAWTCYGIVVDDLLVWRPLLAHIVEQLDRGNVVLVEVDAFHLPDTVGTLYQREHVKTVIAVTGYDRHAHRLRYLHGAVGHELHGDDLDAMLTAGIGSAQLPPFAQIIKLDRLIPRSASERVTLGVALARYHCTKLPVKNPVRAFADGLRAHGAWLAGGDAELYRRWAFATLQQCGATFEISADVTAWLAANGEPVGAAVSHLRDIAYGAKSLHTKLARVPISGRMPDVSLTLDQMADSWDFAMTTLQPRYSK